MKKLISVKLDPELLKYLDDRSKKENRARNNLIETILINEREREAVWDQEWTGKARS